MAGYTTKKHSESLKALGSEMDSIREDKAKELIYNIVRPIKAMNDQIYGMASDYDGFIDDPASNAVLCQIQSLNAQILEILARKHFPSPSSTTNNSDAKPQTTAKPKSSTAESTSKSTNTNDEIMPLSSLIGILSAKQFDEDRLSAQLQKHALSTKNVLRADLRAKVLSVLRECAFSDSEAESLLSALAQNLGTSTDSAAPSNSKANAKSAADIDSTDEFGVKVVELTLTAIDGVFEGEVSVSRSDIARIYGAHRIDTVSLSAMTERRFTELLKQCAVRGGAHSQFTRPQCVKIHRAIKTLLNAPQSDRYDIDIAAAALFLLANNEALRKKQLTIDEERIRAAFEGCSARSVMSDGKKAFIKKLGAAGNGEIKVGHGTKVWNGLKQFVEDSNANVPQSVVIKDFKEKEAKEVEEVEEVEADDVKEAEVESATPKAASNESL